MSSFPIPKQLIWTGSWSQSFDWTKATFTHSRSHPENNQYIEYFSTRFKNDYFDCFHFTLILTESAIFVLTWGSRNQYDSTQFVFKARFLTLMFSFLFEGNEGRKMSLMSRRLSNYIYYLKDSRSFRHQIMTIITTNYSA